MKIATWNVNSIRVRLPHVLDWLAQQQPDVLCLQETKVPDEEFPADAFNQVGYSVAYAGQKTYNGVATLSRLPTNEITRELPAADGAQKRLLVATVGDVRVVNVYVPNGEAVDSDKYGYKLAWLKALRNFSQGRAQGAPQARVARRFQHRPRGSATCTIPSCGKGTCFSATRNARLFGALVADGLVDVFRKFDQPAASFSWWDYRMGAFRRDLGLRIDHILASRALASTCRACYIDKAPRGLERPSDHAPVIAEFEI